MWNRTASAKLFLDGRELAIESGPATQMTSTQPAAGAGQPTRARIRLEGGKQYALRIEYRQPGAGGTMRLGWIPPADAALSEAMAVVKESDVAVVFVGLSSELEGEEMRGVNIPGFLGGDRTSLDLPAPQENLVKAAIATGKPVVVVLTSGSAMAANYAAAHASAVLMAWYGGEEAGTGIAQTLAGASNPAGRLPVTFYRSVEQLPPFNEYAMKGRTYRYFTGEALYPFGFGLSYSKFEYSGLDARRTASGATLRVSVKYTSSRDGDEVVQLYVAGEGGAEAPLRNLRGFQRIHLRAGERRELQFTLTAADLPPSPVEVSVGGGQPATNVPHLRGML
jgi:beta-glucosidase